MAKPLLSICIPTYNRASFLEIALASLVSQKAFLESDDIEIVISDNASTDGTQQICESYAQKFPSKFLYHRNPENIGGDLNFEKVISLSRGAYAKLTNDYLYATDGALGEMAGFVRDNLAEKPELFFLQGRMNKKDDKHICNNFDEFIDYVSFRTTWIGSFGVWREDFDKIIGFSRASGELLVQTDVIFRLMASGKKAVVYSKEYLKNIETYNKNQVSWNHFKVSCYNYLNMLLPYVENGQLSRKTYQSEKKKLLRILIRIYVYKRIDVPEEGEIAKYVLPFYKRDWFFYAMLPYAAFSYLRGKISDARSVKSARAKLKVKIYGFLSSKFPQKASYKTKYEKYKRQLENL
ncbi:Glycosyltransferase involved in cell wall bisynthesis [Parelusimicrobium proximum]|uniref:glycosyltransferase family 2 protein n=1 Tax=Parelusimicrobium proximum TaxID=3228953 RepID=UPI003D163892